MRNSRVAEAMVIVAIATGCAQGQGTVPSLPAGYAGSEMCGACHEDIAKAFAKNPHDTVETDSKRGWESRACEACHGPGQKHTESTSADDIRNPSKLNAAATGKICMTC